MEDLKNVGVCAATTARSSILAKSAMQFTQQIVLTGWAQDKALGLALITWADLSSSCL